MGVKLENCQVCGITGAYKSGCGDWLCLDCMKLFFAVTLARAGAYYRSTFHGR